MPSSTPLQRIRGILFFVAMTTNMITIFILFFPWVVSMLIPNKSVHLLRRKYCTYLNNIYFMGNAALIFIIGGTKMVIHGDDKKFLEDQSVLILSNHRTTVDWMFSGWCYAACLTHYPCLNFVLKESLRLVPFFGWCMQMVVYIFLSRKRDQDIPRIKRVMNYLSHVDESPAIFLFPEGTDLSRSNKQKSLEYAKTNNLHPMQYVLFPKAGGLQTVMSLVREKGMVVHDITLGYVDSVEGQRTSEVSMFYGHFPKELHMFVDRYTAADIPASEEDMKKWLTQTYRDKEYLLAQFYEQTLPGHKSEFINLDEVKDSKDINFRKKLNPNIIMTSNDMSFFRRKLAPLAFINFFTYIFASCFYHSWVFRVVFVLYCCCPMFGGLELCEMYFSEKLFNK